MPFRHYCHYAAIDAAIDIAIDDSDIIIDTLRWLLLIIFHAIIIDATFSLFLPSPFAIIAIFAIDAMPCHYADAIIAIISLMPLFRFHFICWYFVTL